MHKLLVLDMGYALPTYGFDGHIRQWQSSADHTAALLLCAYARTIAGNVLSAAAKPDLPSLAVA
ncbi:hypothetical protein JNM87_00345 [Candidatus Saccharibacteria bacterium]|nr:hypothetical protein [Candidatus Saccharibacteria bacterium]